MAPRRYCHACGTGYEATAAACPACTAKPLDHHPRSTLVPAPRASPATRPGPPRSVAGPAAPLPPRGFLVVVALSVLFGAGSIALGFATMDAAAAPPYGGDQSGPFYIGLGALQGIAGLGLGLRLNAARLALVGAFGLAILLTLVGLSSEPGTELLLIRLAVYVALAAYLTRPGTKAYTHRTVTREHLALVGRLGARR